MTPYPLLFEPILEKRAWGGESWELADRSVIARGPLAGKSLGEAITARPQEILGAARLAPRGGFPLLIRLLDADENGPVEVTASRAAAAEPQHALEAWIVIRARPGAVIYKGLKPHVSPEQLARHIETGDVVDDLVAVPVEPGDCHALEGGVCHALGAGVVAAGIRTPMQTFRVYDWGRPGRARDLERALRYVRFGGPPTPHGARTGGEPLTVGAIRTTPLLRTKGFAVERIETDRETRLAVETSGVPAVWMMLEGRCRLEAPPGGSRIRP